MKITYNTGCTSHGVLSIDEENFYNLSLSAQKSCITKLLNIANEDAIYEFLCNICEHQGESENLGYCEECGDYCTKYTIKI